MTQDLSRLPVVIHQRGTLPERLRSATAHPSPANADWRNDTFNDLDWNRSNTETLGGALKYLFAFVRRHWWLLALGPVLGCLVAPLALILEPPLYYAQATIMFDTGKIQILQGPAMVSESSLDSSAGLESQVHIIQSELVARRVIERLNLKVDPDFQVPLVGRFERIFGHTLAALVGKVVPRSEAWHDRYRLDTFRDSLKVSRVENTFAIGIQWAAKKPERAAQIVNAITEAYLFTLTDERHEIGQRTGDWLKTRLADLRNQATTSQQSVVNFRMANSLIEGGGRQLLDTRISSLNSQLMAERSRGSELQARLERVDSAIKEYATAVVKPSVPDLMNNPLVNRLREQYLELLNRRSEWEQQYGKNHEANKRIRQRLAEIQTTLVDEYKRLAESYRSDLTIAHSREITITAELKQAVGELHVAQGALIQLRELESSAQAFQSLYDGFLRRYSETAGQEKFPIPRARVINEATEPLGQNYKKTTRIMMFLMTLCTVLLFLTAVIREMRDSSFRTLTDVEQTLGINLLSVVPAWSARQANKSLKIWAETELPQPPKTIQRRSGLTWAGDLAPDSQFAEAVRSIKLRLDQRAGSGTGYVLGVTSIQPNEGSTTVAAALAVAMASSGARVLLMDWDLRHPALTKLLTPTATTGLRDVLRGTASLEDVSWTDQPTGLVFVPVIATIDTRADETLASAKLKSFIDKTRSDFDYIIADLPPLVPMVDVVMTTECVDSYICVIEWGRTQQQMSKLAINRVPYFRDQLAGIVLNKVNLKHLHLYDPNASQWFDENNYANYASTRKP